MKQKLEKIKVFLIENYKWIILFICIISLIVLIEDVMDNDIMAFDEKGYFIISRYLMSDTMTSIAKCITNFANMFWLIGVSIFALLFLNNRLLFIFIFSSSHTLNAISPFTKFIYVASNMLFV